MNGNILAPDWLFKGPMDIEYKTYSMMAEIKHLYERLESGDIEGALTACDAALDYFYMYDAIYDPIAVDYDQYLHNKETAIEIFQPYLHPQMQKYDEIVNSITPNAIERYEDLHRSIRTKWQEIEASITVSYMHTMPLLINDGYALVVTGKICYVYEFSKTYLRGNDWRDFKITEVDKIKSDQKVMAEFTKKIKDEDETSPVLKVNCAMHTRIREDLITVVRSSIFHRIKSDYSF